MTAIQNFWSILMTIWSFMDSHYILNSGGFSVSFADLLIWTAFISIIIWAIHQILVD